MPPLAAAELIITASMLDNSGRLMDGWMDRLPVNSEVTRTHDVTATSGSRSVLSPVHTGD